MGKSTITFGEHFSLQEKIKMFSDMLDAEIRTMEGLKNNGTIVSYSVIYKCENGVYKIQVDSTPVLIQEKQ